MTVNEFRRTTLGLRDVVEGCHMGHPDFRINNRIFASLNAEQTVGTVKLSPEEQQRFVERDATVFVPAAGAWGLQGWTKVHLAAADAELVGEALTLGWQAMSAQPAARPRRTRETSPRRAGTASAGAADLAVSAKKASVKSTRGASASKAAASTGKTAPRKVAASKASTTRASTPKVARTAASKAPAAATAVIDDYIARCEPAVRTILNTVRDIVRAEAPDAVEKFSYRMPAFEMDGMLLYYAPFKQHLGIFPPVKGDAALDKALAPYRGEKSNLRFPFDRAMPYPLIRRVVRARLKEHQAHLAKRRAKVAAPRSRAAARTRH
ncbi:MAG: DUF1801 domain-containing protein [Vicinamibacterales bacterium]